MINNNNINKIKSLISKYGINRVINMVVNGKHTIKQIYINNPSEYLNQFNDLTILKIDNIIYYVDKDNLPLLIYYPNHKYNAVYINNDKIWFFFSRIINIEYSEIQSIIKKWLEQSHNLNGLTPIGGLGSVAFNWKNI